jgi:AraC-like DNA-binding protein
MTDNTQKGISKHYFGYLIKGNAKIKTKKAELIVKPNEIFYIPKGLKYQSEWFGEEIEFYSFGFEISPINKSFVLQKIDCGEKAREVFHELCQEIHFKQIGIGKLYYFFELVAGGMIEADMPIANAVVEKAIEFMSNNPTVRIPDVAKACNISEPSIYLLFKKNLSKTPNEVRNKILCDKAILMLSTTNKSVEEISNTLNFSSTSYFRKILKAYTGKNPLQIRKESAF